MGTTEVWERTQGTLLPSGKLPPEGDPGPAPAPRASPGQGAPSGGTRLGQNKGALSPVGVGGKWNCPGIPSRGGPDPGHPGLQNWNWKSQGSGCFKTWFPELLWIPAGKLLGFWQCLSGWFSTGLLPASLPAATLGFYSHNTPNLNRRCVSFPPLSIPWFSADTNWVFYVLISTLSTHKMPFPISPTPNHSGLWAQLSTPLSKERLDVPS